MKNKMVRRKDVCSIEDLLNRHMGTESMGLLWWVPGNGKTTNPAYSATVYSRLQRKRADIVDCKEQKETRFPS